METPIRVEAAPWFEFDDPPLPEPPPRTPTPVRPSPRIERVIRQEIVDDYNPWTGAWLIEEQRDEAQADVDVEFERVDEAPLLGELRRSAGDANGGRWIEDLDRDGGQHGWYESRERQWNDQRRQREAAPQQTVELTEEPEGVYRGRRRRRSRLYYRRHRIDRPHHGRKGDADPTFGEVQNDADIEITDAVAETVREVTAADGKPRPAYDRYPRRTRRRRYVRRFVNNESAEEFRGEFNERTVRRVERPEADDSDAA